MKIHTNGYKNGIKKFGRQIDSKITYLLENEEIELGSEELISISQHYESNILKSVMKQLDIESMQEIPVDTIINYQFGIKVNDDYEYLDFGNYIVYKTEKQEDTNSWKIMCYDKMLYSMKDYEDINITYPITIRSYINSICLHLGLVFKNASTTFANYDKQIQNELYLDVDGNSIGYSFRDVLDELAQVTASTICIDRDDKLEIRYINETNDVIDEEYLKNINVNFGEKYGPINSIVLSRSAESDNVYLQDDESIAENGLCELKIIDNQIMNFNDRASYLPDILQVLDGFEYYTNDFSSTGITYYDLCDKYIVNIDNNNYNCIMLNNEINITQGLEENIYTVMPKETETEYKYASKDDKQTNRTYIIAKKNEAKIEALASKVVDISNTIFGNGSIRLENAYEGILHKLSIKGQISLLFPQSTPDLYSPPFVPYNNEILYPNSDLYPKSHILLIDNVEYNLDIDFLNYIDNTTCDEFIYEDGECKIIRRVGIDINGEKYELDNEIIEQREPIELYVNNSSVIQLKSFENVILSSTYLLQNEYTSTFANQVEVKSELNLMADNLEAKVSANEVIAKLNLAIRDELGVVELIGNQVIIESDNFRLDESGKITSIAGKIAGFDIDKNDGFIYKIYAPYDYTQEDLDRVRGIMLGTIIPTAEDYEKYDLNNDGAINSADYLRIYWYFREAITTTNNGMFGITIPKENKLDSAITGYVNGYGELVSGFNFSKLISENLSIKYNGVESISAIGSTGNITCVSLTQTSKEEMKKNFEKYNNALETIKDTDIYKYHFKNQEDNEKKHIGFVIGKNFNYSNDITASDNEGNEIGVDVYSMVSVCFQAIKEQQKAIEKLQEKISKLERKMNE